MSIFMEYTAVSPTPTTCSIPCLPAAFANDNVPAMALLVGNYVEDSLFIFWIGRDTPKYE